MGIFGSHKNEKEYIRKFLYGYEEGFLYPAFNSLNYADRNEISDYAKSLMSCLEEAEALFMGASSADLYCLLRGNYPYSVYRCETDLDRVKKYSGEYFPAVLIAGMLHPNGYIREKSVILSSEYPDLLPIILSMINDHTENVRNAAEKAFFDILPYADILTVMLACAAADTLSRKCRLDPKALVRINEALKNRVEAETTAEDIYGLIITAPYFSDDREPLKRALNKSINKLEIADILFRNKMLGEETARTVMEKYTGFSSRAAHFYISSYDPDKKELFGFLSSKEPVIRTRAAEKLYLKEGLWKGAEGMLLDRAKGVRDRMIFYFSRSSDLDLREFYRKHFPAETAIKGLGELCNPEDAEFILPLVDSCNEKTAAAAIYALSKTGREKYTETYYKYICDPRKSVAKSAYNALTYFEFIISPEIVYKDIINNQNNGIYVKRLVKLLLRLSRWSAMPYLIRLYNLGSYVYEVTVPAEINISVKDLNGYICFAIRNAVEKRSCYFTAGNETAALIRKALDDSDIPDSLKRSILFEIRDH